MLRLQRSNDGLYLLRINVEVSQPFVAYFNRQRKFIMVLASVLTKRSLMSYAKSVLGASEKTISHTCQ